MKPEDLMINDIVYAVINNEDDETGEYVEERHPAMITDLSPNTQLWADGHECKYLLEYLDDCKDEGVDDIEPIPLTEEILEKNGFVYNEKFQCLYRLTRDGTWRIATDIDRTWLRIEQREFPFHECKMRANYLHELQHALRLCGLTDLANSFKV